MSLFRTSRDYTISTEDCRIGTKRKKLNKTEPPPDRYSCDICSEECDSETDVYAHRQQKHRNEINDMRLNDLVCKICIKKQASQEDLLKHIKVQHLLSSENAQFVERDIFICDFCGSIYFNKDLLISHLKFSHDNDNKRSSYVNCPKCHREIRVLYMWFHFQRHLFHSISCCPICLKKCKNQKDFHEHIAQHPYYFMCTMCGYDTKKKPYFVEHIKIHERPNVPDDVVLGEEFDKLAMRCFRPHSAKKCDRYHGVKGLRLPELSVCILCRALCTSDKRAMHIYKVHMHKRDVVKKTYSCSCGESFFNKVLLKHHCFKLKGDHTPALCDPDVSTAASSQFDELQNENQS